MPAYRARPQTYNQQKACGDEIGIVCAAEFMVYSLDVLADKEIDNPDADNRAKCEREPFLHREKTTLS